MVAVGVNYAYANNTTSSPNQAPMIHNNDLQTRQLCNEAGSIKLSPDNSWATFLMLMP
ncbi:hypothetical protein [Halomonas salinarum]|uniref:hypothetical protein n=1 Tax=Halomonas salinarum TaxID=1158993 RepID=UPI0014392F0E|nr:hypothetical protein [Halomonas salinarum]